MMKAKFSILVSSLCTICFILTFSAALLGVLSLSTYAGEPKPSDTQFEFEIRERYEHQENYNDKFYGTTPKQGESRDDYLLSRIRIGVNHQFSPELKGKISLQDARAFGWGFDDQDWKASEFGGIENNPQIDPLELGQTWLQFQAHKDVSIIAGRQAIFYGNTRVFGPGEWKNSGKWVWDAAKISYQRGDHFVDAFYGKTKLHDPGEFSLNHRHGYTGAGVYGHYAIGKHASVEPILAMKQNDRSNDYRERTQYYYGLRAYHNALGIGFVDATYIKATGENVKNNGSEVDIDASGYNVDAGLKITPQWKAGVTYSYASGDDKSTPDDERFDGVFGATDKYYGRMNLMEWSNLRDYGLFINYTPKKEFLFELEYHKFYADEIKDKWRAYTNLNATSDHYGDEVDLAATWAVNPTWTIMTGVTYFMPGDLIRQAAPKQAFLTDDEGWGGFIQVTYRYKGYI